MSRRPSADRPPASARDRSSRRVSTSSGCSASTSGSPRSSRSPSRSATASPSGPFVVPASSRAASASLLERLTARAAGRVGVREGFLVVSLDVAARRGVRVDPVPLRGRRAALEPARRVLRGHVRLHDHGRERRHGLRRDQPLARACGASSRSGSAAWGSSSSRSRFSRRLRVGGTAAHGVRAARARDRGSRRADPIDRAQALVAVRRTDGRADAAARRRSGWLGIDDADDAVRGASRTRSRPCRPAASRRSPTRRRPSRRRHSGSSSCSWRSQARTSRSSTARFVRRRPERARARRGVPALCPRCSSAPRPRAHGDALGLRHRRGRGGDSRRLLPGGLDHDDDRDGERRLRALAAAPPAHALRAHVRRRLRGLDRWLDQGRPPPPARRRSCAARSTRRSAPRS